MKKLFTIVVFVIFSIIGKAQEIIQFNWLENGVSSDGYYSPAIKLSVGETHQLQYNATPNVLNLFADKQNWVFYEQIENTWVVVDQPQTFSISNEGVVTGLQTGIAAIKPTRYILGGNERLYIEVNESNETEPNDMAEYASELTSYPLTFYLSSQNDIDWFKVYAQQGDEITFKISCLSPLFQNYIFQVETYDSQMTMWNKFNKTLSPEIPSFEVPLTAHYVSGYYFVKIYSNINPIFFCGERLSIQAFINGKPLSNVTTILIEENHSNREQYYNINGQLIDLNTYKGIVIKNDGKNTTKFINR